MTSSASSVIHGPEGRAVRSAASGGMTTATIRPSTRTGARERECAACRIVRMRIAAPGPRPYRGPRADLGSVGEEEAVRKEALAVVAALAAAGPAFAAGVRSSNTNTVTTGGTT